MSLSVAGCAFCDWPVGIGLPSLKYSNTLHAKFVCVSLKPSRPTILYFVLYIVFEWTFRFAYLRRGEDGFLMNVGTSL